MVLQLDSCRVFFPDWFDERAEWEAERKGWLPGVEIETGDGSRYPVTFFDPVRLAQDLEEMTRHGTPVFIEIGLVVIPTITRVAILQAVPELVRQRFFDHLKPIVVPVANGVAR